MVDRFIPSIGSTGFYRLAAPFELPAGERYTCKAIRKISEHRSLGSDVFKDFYEPKGIDVSIFDVDNKEDAEIISLMASGGKWIHVPSRYILGFPDMNGIPYRGVALHITLPPFPLTHNFGNVIGQIQDTITASLGVVSVIKPVETTRTSLVPFATHEANKALRLAATTGLTPSARAVHWQNQYEALLQKYTALEDAYVALLAAP